MSLTEHSIRFGAGPVPLDMSIRKDVPFWESIEAHYRSIREKAIADARKDLVRKPKIPLRWNTGPFLTKSTAWLGTWKKPSQKLFVKWKKHSPIWPAR